MFVGGKGFVMDVDLTVAISLGTGGIILVLAVRWLRDWDDLRRRSGADWLPRPDDDRVVSLE